MINANELRIGNYVRCNVSNDAGIYCVYKVGGWIRNWGTKKKGIGFVDEQLIMLTGGARDEEEYPESRISPIKLTPEILINCGFNKITLDDDNEKGGYYYELNFNNKAYSDLGFVSGDKNGIFEVCLFPYETWFRFKYLHQLQNLYFALTGKELEYNP